MEQSRMGAGPPALLGGRYQLQGELGRGATATVFLANDLQHDRQVAVKVLRPEISRVLGPERFLREIKIAARLATRTSFRCTTAARPRVTSTT